MLRSDLQPHVFFTIGNTIIPSHDYLRSFEFTNNLAGVFSGKLDLYDPTWIELEAVIVDAGYGAETIFKFGWSDNLSQSYQAKILDYGNEFTADGLSFDLSFTGSGGKNRQIQRSRQFSADTKISAIIKEIADDNGWESVIEDTAASSTHPFIQHATSDFDFIKRELLPKAINKDGVGGYILSLENNKIRFHTKGYEKPQIYKTYTVYRGMEGEVLNFAPSDECNLAALLGAGQLKVVGVDPRNKKVITGKASPKEGVDRNQKMGDKVTQTAPDGADSKVISKPFHRQEDVDNHAKAKWTEASMANFQATASLMGDPDLQPGKYVTFAIVTSRNTLHYFSGTYQILECTHKIEAGSYTTDLQLMRNAIKKGDLDLQGIKKKLVDNPQVDKNYVEKKAKK